MSHGVHSQVTKLKMLFGKQVKTFPFQKKNILKLIESAFTRIISTTPYSHFLLKALKSARKFCGLRSTF